MSSYNPWWSANDGHGDGVPPVPQQKPKIHIPGVANWSTRASATLIEISIATGIISAYQICLVMFSPVFALVQVIAMIFGTDINGLFAFFNWSLGVVFLLWQWAIRGNTGQSLGQKMMGIRTVDEETGYPLGAGRSILRSLLHVADIGSIFFGYVRPVFQYRGQTFADTIAHSVVVYERKSGGSAR